jgi:hypothetical protein
MKVGGFQMGVEVEGVHEDQQCPMEGVRKFYDLLKDDDKPLYEGCTKHSKFRAIAGLYNSRCMNRWE